MSARSFFSTDTTTTAIYTLSLHDALPIFTYGLREEAMVRGVDIVTGERMRFKALRENAAPLEIVLNLPGRQDRKSTRLNSSHVEISYAVFCLKKKKVAARPMPSRWMIFSV